MPIRHNLAFFSTEYPFQGGTEGALPRIRRERGDFSRYHLARVCDDFELLDRWRAKDAKAGRELFGRQFPVLLRFFRNKIGAGAVEDLVQATLLRCLEARKPFRGDASFRTYLLVIARNVLYDHLKRAHRNASEPLDTSVVAVSDLIPSPSFAAAARGRRRLLLRALRNVPIEDQVALELYYWEDMSATELGAVLDLTEPAVRSRLRRAKERLREQLARHTEIDASLTTAVALDAWAREIRDDVARPED